MQPIVRKIASGDPIDAALFKGAISRNTSYFVQDDGVKYNVNLEKEYSGNKRRKYVLPINGVITKYGYFFTPGSKERTELIKMADQDPSIDEIILLIDSGGGFGWGTHDLSLAIRNCSTPIIAVIEDVTASAAYWIACSADKIYATNKTAEVGGIGSYSSVWNDKEFWESHGIYTEDVYAEQSTLKNIEIRQFREEGKTDAAKKEVSKHCQMFIDTVKEFRPNVQDKDGVFNGALFTGEKALELGLIDGIKSLDEVLSFDSKTTNKAA